MNLIVVGRSVELAGFALAGAQTVACDSPTEVPAIVARASATETGAALVLVSPWIAQHAAGTIEAIQHRKGPPVIVVMPAAGG